MTLEEAIVTALDYEVRVRNHYARAAEETTDARGKEIFSVLAEEEQHHVDYLQSRLEQWRSSSKVSAAIIKTMLPNPQWLREGKAKMHKISLDGGYDHEIALLKDALKLEEEVSGHYRKLVGELAGEGQAMFRRFMEIEEGHTAIVQAEIDALQGDGFWFSLREFDLEAG